MSIRYFLTLYSVNKTLFALREGCELRCGVPELREVHLLGSGGVAQDPRGPGVDASHSKRMEDTSGVNKTLLDALTLRLIVFLVLDGLYPFIKLLTDIDGS